MKLFRDSSENPIISSEKLSRLSRQHPFPRGEKSWSHCLGLSLKRGEILLQMQFPWFNLIFQHPSPKTLERDFCFRVAFVFVGFLLSFFSCVKPKMSFLWCSIHLSCLCWFSFHVCFAFVLLFQRRILIMRTCSLRIAARQITHSFMRECSQFAIHS